MVTWFLINNTLFRRTYSYLKIRAGYPQTTMRYIPCPICDSRGMQKKCLLRIYLKQFQLKYLGARVPRDKGQEGRE